MDNHESLTPISSDCSHPANVMIITDDQHFLLHFILGTYFGPDLKDEKPKKSVLQRKSEGLEPYTSDQLAGSQLKVVEIERVYYYVLRKADRSVIVKLPLFHQFLQGVLHSSTDASASYSCQFPDLFPLQFHHTTRFKNRYKIIADIVFINNPEICYIKPEDVERFKILTGLDDLLLDRDAARLYSGNVIGGLPDNLEGHQSNGQISMKTPRKYKKRKEKLNLEDIQPLSCVSGSQGYSGEPAIPGSTNADDETIEKVGPAMLFLPSYPAVDEWENIVACAKNGIALTGSAAERSAGPLIGLVDIGISDDAYLFRVSLPGVKKDERVFSCEVESNGLVSIKGVTTTGDELVFKGSEVFEMQTQFLCPPGKFSISFQLPGPVEPREFSGNFRPDGILEGVVMKEC